MGIDGRQCIQVRGDAVSRALPDRGSVWRPPKLTKYRCGDGARTASQRATEMADLDERQRVDGLCAEVLDELVGQSGDECCVLARRTGIGGSLVMLPSSATGKTRRVSEICPPMLLRGFSSAVAASMSPM